MATQGTFAELDAGSMMLDWYINTDMLVFVCSFLSINFLSTLTDLTAFQLAFFETAVLARCALITGFWFLLRSIAKVAWIISTDLSSFCVDAAREAFSLVAERYAIWVYGPQKPWHHFACWTTPKSTLLRDLLSGSHQRMRCVWFVDRWDMLYLAIFCLLIGGAVYIAYRIARRMLGLASPIGGELASRWISHRVNRTTQPRRDASMLRQVFRTQPEVRTIPMSSNTHGESAAKRSAASHFMVGFARTNGLEPYMVQQSKSDVRKGLDGCRTYYWAKDLGVQAAPFQPPEDALIVIVDVDYYMDMITMLAEYVHPTMIYTCVPAEAGATRTDYSYSFQTTGALTYESAGGGSYTHMLWNWSEDTLLARRKDLFYTYCVTYMIDRRQIDADHQIIFLTPERAVSFPLVDFSHRLAANPLVRVQPVTGDFVRLRLSTSEGTFVSTGKTNVPNAATITAADDAALASTQNWSTIGIMPATVQRLVAKDKVSPSGVPLLVEYFRNQHAKITKFPDLMVTVESGRAINRYQFREYEPMAHPVVVPFMQPLITGCFAPDKTIGNLEHMVDKRIKEVASNAQVTPFLMQMTDEFNGFAIPTPHQLYPADLEEVKIRQARPMQQQIVQQALEFNGTSRNTIKSFLKGESTQKVGPGRNISTFDPEVKIPHACFMYALDDTMKSQHWYAFGKTPREVAEKVGTICVDAEYVTEGDASKMDGHISPVARYAERAFMHRAFAVETHNALNESLDKQVFQKGYVKTPKHAEKTITYDQGTSRGSGSGETSYMNTYESALMAYTAFRMRDYEPQQAWDALGLYAGDDTLTANLERDAYIKAGAMFGQVMEVTIRKTGEPVTFLARYYTPNVWHGAVDSMCDVRRQLVKLHTTVRLPGNISPMDKLLEKCLGYWFTDANTPIIGDFVSTVLEVHGRPVKRLDVYRNHLRNWFSRFEHPDDRYPNANTELWMYDIVNELLPEFDHGKFARWLKQIREGASPLNAPLFVIPDAPENVSKDEAIINHEVVPAGTVNTATEEPAPVPQQAVQVAPSAIADPFAGIGFAPGSIVFADPAPTNPAHLFKAKNVFSEFLDAPHKLPANASNHPIVYATEIPEIIDWGTFEEDNTGFTLDLDDPDDDWPTVEPPKVPEMPLNHWNFDNRIFAHVFDKDMEVKRHPYEAALANEAPHTLINGVFRYRGINSGPVIETNSGKITTATGMKAQDLKPMVVKRPTPTAYPSITFGPKYYVDRNGYTITPRTANSYQVFDIIGKQEARLMADIYPFHDVTIEDAEETTDKFIDYFGIQIRQQTLAAMSHEARHGLIDQFVAWTTGRLEESPPQAKARRTGTNQDQTPAPKLTWAKPAATDAQPNTRTRGPRAIPPGPEPKVEKEPESHPPNSRQGRRERPPQPAKQERIATGASPMPKLQGDAAADALLALLNKAALNAKGGQSKPATHADGTPAKKPTRRGGRRSPAREGSDNTGAKGP
jgi:hypothetical protein